MSGSLAPAQIARQIEAIRKRRPDERVIGLHAAAAWSGGATLRAGGEEIEVAPCRSELEIRERLCERAADAPPLVILTALAEADLGQDVLARLARRRLHRVERWELLKDLFGARTLDSRLGRSPWLVDAVLELAADAPLPPAPGGFLSLDDVWELLLKRALALPNGAPDLVALLEWSLGAEVERFAALRDEVKGGIRARVEASAGAAGALLLDAVAAGYGADALALGLVFDIVTCDAGAGEVALAAARGRLDRFAGNRPIAEAAARAWARAAREVVRKAHAEERFAALSAQLQRAEALLREIGIAEYARFSDVLPAGLELRLAAFGTAVEAFLEVPEALGAVTAAAAAVRAHSLLAGEPERARSLEMAERLCRYLTTPAVAPGSFAAAAAVYAREGALVDRALTALIGGDPDKAFSRASEKLRATVVARCEAQARDFATLLAGWTEADGSRDGALPIEDVLERVVAPLASRNPVLLVVLDGMSGAVFEEIASDLTLPGSGWLVLRPEEADAAIPLAPSAPPVIAALPTLTEVSRASLLCGALTSGAQAVERKGFVGNAALLRVTNSKFPPRLFHKGELTGRRETDLAEDLRDAIAGTDHRVVGVVLNAVDDFLAKSDQLRHAWRHDSIHLLRPLLETAGDAGRVVILTSDHGHVLDSGAERATKADADRYRLSDEAPGDGEVLLAGRRVAASLGGRIIAAWSRHLRYGGKKNGYHGGAAPQEVVVPLGVFAPLGLQVEGWRETALFRPDWWLGEPVESTPAVKPAAPKTRSRKPVPALGQRDLFAPGGETDDSGTAPPWLDELLASELFRQQLAAAGRVAPPVDRVRLVLLALNERGGKLTRRGLAQRLALPPSRVQGLVAGLRRVLNIDGYNVLEIDEPSDSLSVNVDLIVRQFGISLR